MEGTTSDFAQQKPKDPSEESMQLTSRSTQPIYRPLDHPRHDFRLLEVLPSSPDGLICVHMWEAQMATEAVPVDYRCLSYMWGDESETFQIMVNDRPYSVRKNLFEFLQMAQRRFNKTPLWIDALCINQTDTDERNHQVQSMGQIYRDAREVLVWLGPEPELDSLFDTASLRLYEIRNGPPMDGFRTLDEYFDCLRSEMSRLCDHVYWKRAWIIQEILIARNVRILNERTEMAWDCFPIWDGFQRFCDDRSQMSPLFTFIYLRDMFHGDKRTTLKRIHRMLVLSPDSQCQDKRDRIYSLKAVSESGNEFEVDYREDTYSLFWRAGEWFSIWDDPWAIKDLAAALELSAEDLLMGIAARKPIITLGIRRVTRAMKDPKKGAVCRCPFNPYYLFYRTRTPEDIMLCNHVDEQPACHTFISTSSDGGLHVDLRYPIPISSDFTYQLGKHGLLLMDGKQCINGKEMLLTNDGANEALRYRIRLPVKYVLSCVEGPLM